LGKDKKIIAKKNYLYLKIIVCGVIEEKDRYSSRRGDQIKNYNSEFEVSN